MKKLMLWYKLGFAVLVLAAVAAQFYHGTQKTGFSPVNFFSFFTIESNIFAAIVFLVSAAAQGAKKRSLRLDCFRGAATLYMLITGIVYSLLLSNAEVQTPIPWVNAVLHYIFPVVVLLDWLIDHASQKLRLKHVWLWVSFPVAYLLYSLIRGPLAHNWYPYPFLHAEKLGYLRVAVTSAIIGAFVVFLAIVVARLPHYAAKRSAKRAARRRKFR